MEEEWDVKRYRKIVSVEYGNLEMLTGFFLSRTRTTLTRQHELNAQETTCDGCKSDRFAERESASASQREEARAWVVHSDSSLDHPKISFITNQFQPLELYLLDNSYAGILTPIELRDLFSVDHNGASSVRTHVCQGREGTLLPS